MTLGALGVVFGDIGTSPLYAIQTVFSSDATRPVPVQPETIYGVISLVFWTIMVVVTIKYVTLILRADDDGEGGLLSLVALLTRSQERFGKGVLLATLGVFGASLFFGDSIITPAISVLSAMEGLEVASPSLESIVVPGAVVLLIGLFAAQRFGTGAVGKVFGPVMLVWFAAIAACGIRGIVDHPTILQALSPTWAIRYFVDDGLTAFLSLGGVVLAVTGAEALYADMGHFGRSPIRRAWLLVAFPALALNYLGQGALLVADPGGVSNPFYLLVPHWGRIPMVVLATAATLIASQAVISGAFSVAQQAARLGYLPRLRLTHTSAREPGQIYIPFINWLVMTAVLVLVLVFESSSRLAAAYGVAVTGTIIITATLYFTLVHRSGKRSVGLVVAGAIFFIGVDAVLLGANLVKVVDGGYIPLAIASAAFLVMVTWRRGRELAGAARLGLEGQLDDFVGHLRDQEVAVRRVPGTAVFLSRGDGATPLAMRQNVERNHVLHRRVVVLTVRNLPIPRVAAEERLKVRDLGRRGDGIDEVVASFGYRERLDLPAVLHRARQRSPEKGDIDLDDITYFVSALELHPAKAQGGMAMWRKRLFIATGAIGADPVRAFHLPRARTITMAADLEI